MARMITRVATVALTMLCVMSVAYAKDRDEPTGASEELTKAFDSVETAVKNATAVGMEVGAETAPPEQALLEQTQSIDQQYGSDLANSYTDGSFVTGGKVRGAGPSGNEVTTRLDANVDRYAEAEAAEYNRHKATVDAAQQMYEQNKAKDEAAAAKARAEQRAGMNALEKFADTWKHEIQKAGDLFTNKKPSEAVIVTVVPYNYNTGRVTGEPFQMEYFPGMEHHAFRQAATAGNEMEGRIRIIDYDPPVNEFTMESGPGEGGHEKKEPENKPGPNPTDPVLPIPAPDLTFTLYGNDGLPVGIDESIQNIKSGYGTTGKLEVDLSELAALEKHPKWTVPAGCSAAAMSKDVKRFKDFKVTATATYREGLPFDTVTDANCLGTLKTVPLVCTRGKTGDSYWEFELPVNPESATGAKKFYVPISWDGPWTVDVAIKVECEEYMWKTNSRTVQCGGHTETDDYGNTTTSYHTYVVQDLVEWYESRSFPWTTSKTIEVKGHMYEDDFTGDS